MLVKPLYQIYTPSFDWSIMTLQALALVNIASARQGPVTAPQLSCGFVTESWLISLLSQSVMCWTQQMWVVSLRLATLSRCQVRDQVTDIHTRGNTSLGAHPRNNERETQYCVCWLWHRECGMFQQFLEKTRDEVFTSFTAPCYRLSCIPRTLHLNALTH